MPAPIPAAAMYRGHRFPPEIINSAVWRYPALFAQPAGCGGAPGRPGRGGDQRDDRPMGAHVRPGVRPGPAAAWPPPWRQVALGRSSSDIRRAVGGWDYTPRVVITNKLASYPPALRRVLPDAEHRRHKGLNNRAENSHLPTRQREWRMQRFKSSEQAHRFLEPFSTSCNHFSPRRHRLTAAPTAG